jgi:hypothetical protein
LWNGANETTFHRRIKTPKKTQRRRPRRHSEEGLSYLPA